MTEGSSRIGLTGASGFLGRAVARRLTAEGGEVVRLGRTEVRPWHAEWTAGQMEPALADAPPGSVVQFERLGYFAVDPRQAMVFHRTVGLRDEWANIQKRATG